MYKIKTIIASIAFILLIASCDELKLGNEPKELPKGTTLSFARQVLPARSLEDTYTQTLMKNEVPDDTGTISYTSSDDNAATVDNEGVVRLKRMGKVTITATKAATNKYKQDKASYNLTLYSHKFADKDKLQAEIIRAIHAQGNNVDLNYIDTSDITDMSYLFSNREERRLQAFNGDISRWDVSSVTNMERMFNRARSFNGDISKWDVSSVTTMELMFLGTDAFNSDISKWDVSKVTTMRGMFAHATAFDGDISKWNVSSVTNMNIMFEKARSFNGDISKWDVSKVTTMSGMFRDAISFNGDISKWDVSKVTNVKSMFNGATAFTQDLESWKLHKSVITTDTFKDSGVDPLPGWCAGRDCL